MSLMNASFTDRYYGDRSTLERWEDRSGGWDWLGGLDELARYVAMLGGYIPHSPASSAILDVGCGEGLLDALTPEGVLLVSVHARRKHDDLWRKLDRLCETLDSVHVSDDRALDSAGSTVSLFRGETNFKNGSAP